MVKKIYRLIVCRSIEYLPTFELAEHHMHKSIDHAFTQRGYRLELEEDPLAKYYPEPDTKYRRAHWTYRLVTYLYRNTDTMNVFGERAYKGYATIREIIMISKKSDHGPHVRSTDLVDFDNISNIYVER